MFFFFFFIVFSFLFFFFFSSRRRHTRLQGDWSSDVCSSDLGVHPIPIGATGYMAEQLWKETAGAFDKFYPNASAPFRQAFDRIGNPSTPPPETLKAIQEVIEELQRP